MASKNREFAVRWFEEGWNRRNESVVYELLAEDAAGHLPSGLIHGPKDFAKLRTDFLQAFPNMKLIIEDTVEQDDNIVVRWRFEGDHTGAGFGLQPTNKKIMFTGMTWMHFQAGKIVEGWDGWDATKLFQQMGAK